MGRTRPLVFVLLLVLVWGTWQVYPAQSQTGEEYFQETGHRVTGEFLEMYRRAADPLQLYGYPITDAFQDSTTSLLIQYFEKARFELHTDQPAGQRVRLSPLGEYLYVPGQALPNPNASGACRAFEPSGFQVCYSFLEFYNANGGMAQFGAPISNLELQDGRMVQYFQRARFEWRPDLPAQQKVSLGSLGRQYFSMRRENLSLLLPDPGGDIIKGILRLGARAYPAQAVTARRGAQTVYVVVQDQRLLPVANARVTLVVRLPSGQETRFEVLTPTNDQGFTQFTFPFDSAHIGAVSIRAIIQRENLTTETTTSFRIWW